MILKNLAAALVAVGVWAPIAAQLPETLPIVAASGFCGGLVRVIALRERLWPQGLGSIVTGCIVGVFVWPVAEPMLSPWLGSLKLDSITRLMFGAFVTGLMGVSLVGFFLDKTRAIKILKTQPRGEKKDDNDDNA